MTSKLTLSVNGESCELPAPLSVAELLVLRQLGDKHVAVELNGEVIPRALHTECLLQDGDQLEVVSLVGGG